MKKRRSPVRILSTILIICILAISSSIGFYLFYPDISKLKKTNPGKTSFMEYREREWREAGKKNRIRQSWKPRSKISPYVIKAVIISEDDKFWTHDGFDFDAMQKAMDKNIKKGRFQYGGSTISQQLAKNLYLTPSRNPVRKLKEAVLTWRIERTLSKRRILEIYLNVAEWGEGVFGIEAASRRYFGKSASAIDAREAARLVSALPNPRRYNPNGSSRFIGNRSDRIYHIMVRRGIVIEEFESIMKEPETAVPSETPEGPEEAQSKSLPMSIPSQIQDE
jgi:monofunctional biosynthetic peptidoglycan transglycosylase